MGPIEIIVIVLAVAFVAFVIARQIIKKIKAKKSGVIDCGCGCGGSCSGCTHCNREQNLDNQ